MKNKGFATRAIHYSEQFGEKGSLNVPIYQNSTFKQKIPGEWEEYTYTRTNNPTEEALRQAIAGLEGGQYGVIFGSGLAAIGAVTELFGQGDHIISTADIYGGTHRLFERFTQKKGIAFSYVNTKNLDEIKAALKPNTKLIYVETPSNPLLEITDLKALSEMAKAHGALLAVDNTMATPFCQQPLALRADIVIHSTSKYISGHTNVIGGAVVMNDAALFQELKFIHKAVGGAPGPFDCYLTMLGIKTLALRMQQHERNAQTIVEYLKTQQRITKIYYPGLPEHPQHALAKAQMSGFGGIVSFELDGDEAHAKNFLKHLELFGLAISFGSVTSLCSYPAKMSHKEMPREERLRRGFSDSLIRLSVGIENVTDLTADIDQALTKVYS